MGSTTETSGTEQAAEFITFGRRLVDGEPVDEGLTFPRDSPTVKLLADSPHPLISNPQRGEYGAALATAEETGGEYIRAIGITPPGAEGPPEHFHRTYVETFEVVEGELVAEIDSDVQSLPAGETVTGEAGTPHTFRNESDAYTSFIVESRPAGRLNDVITLLFGLAH
jgi:mannose-6-phosphate isomerase-like protein (cupin superfamily)